MLWCSWIQHILSTSKSAVLLNGCPGRWFTCKQGLRQGDPLSPYLFLLVADVLQQLIRTDGGVRHPAMDNASCPVLQYADDTLIVLKAAPGDVIRLKNLLDQFATATGLRINFHKSTIVPMNVDAADLPGLLDILGCRQDSFPQTYLSMPLSNVKLNLSAFTPLIARVDKYLSGWQASLLNAMGRTVLVNAVLDSSLIYILSAMMLPQGTIEELDKRRRAFLWSGESSTSGAQCLVAWKRAYLPKEHGGLGVKDLKTFNQCLLLKLLHRLHHPGDSAWAKWVKNQITVASLAGNIEGAHWDSLKELLPTYRAITTTQVGNGISTSFWFDNWLQAGQLAQTFPALHSHATCAIASVADVLAQPIRAHFVTRLSRAAAAELAALEELLDDVHLSADPDNRLCPLAAKDNILRAGPVYATAMHARADADCPFYKFVWINHAPPRVRFFAWLLVQGKIQCKTNLLLKNIVDDAECELCHMDVESPDHLILHCPTATQFWTVLGITIPPTASVSCMWELPRPDHIPAPSYHTFLLLCAWQLWKHRHDVVFRNMEPSLLRLMLAYKEDARLWRCRLPHALQGIREAWCQAFCLNM